MKYGAFLILAVGAGGILASCNTSENATAPRRLESAKPLADAELDCDMVQSKCDIVELASSSS